MHIGIDARLLHYRTGGISTYIVGLAEAIARIDRANRYTWIESRKTCRSSAPAGFRHFATWTPAHHRLERLTLSLELIPLNLDVLHSTDFIPPLRGARRHVISVHDLTFLRFPEYLTAESRRYYNAQIHAACARADHILTISQSSKQDIKSLLHVPEDKVTVHLPGIDKSFRRPPVQTLAAVRQRLLLPERYFLFVGTFEPRKNIGGLLEAYKMLLERLPDAPPLILAGRPGWLFDETQRYSETLKLGERLQWRCAVEQADLPSLYALADALILPSFYEGWGLPAAEAMACGTVPIVSNRSSLPEVVGPVGLLIDPDDPTTIANALERVLVDDEWRAAQERAAVERALEFRWEDAARIAINVYETVQ
jgi:glycosyltransferase involved in cell wall biosynthesis